MTLADAGTVRVGEADLEYRMIGARPDEAPTIVLLHEGLGCVGLWRDFPDWVARETGLGVFVYSRQGYGGSSPCDVPRPLTYMHEEGERVLPVLLDAIGFRKGILFGHSDGASIATIHAGVHGDPRVHGLILMAPHFFTEDVGIAAIAEARTAFETTDLRERLKRHHGENVDCAFWGWNRAWLDPDFRKWDIRDHLPRIRVPMLVIQGEDDQYGTAAQVQTARQMSGGPVEVRLLPDCRHAPFKEHPDETLAASVAFVRALFPPAVEQAAS